MAIRVLMIPQLSSFDTNEGGIKRVVEAYSRLLPEHGFKMVNPDMPYDLMAVHAGLTNRFNKDVPLVAHTHGLYWVADYPMDNWYWKANADVIASVRAAKEITVPSEWVAETFQRDMRISPHVIHHGIEWQEWAEHRQPNEEYVLWNKNRQGSDAVDNKDMAALAERFPDLNFLTTFATTKTLPNIIVTGMQPHARMKLMVQGAGVYLSLSKETMGIGVMEALAAGVPVLGYNYGGNKITVKHGENGYLARVGDIDDLAEGLAYCVKHRTVLSDNARESVRGFTWEKAVEKVAAVYHKALESDFRPYKI